MEEKNDRYVFVAVRELHGKNCPGDPDTSPVVARFRLSLSTAKIAWYDIATGEWKPYQAFLEGRSGQQENNSKQ